MYIKTDNQKIGQTQVEKPILLIQTGKSLKYKLGRFIGEKTFNFDDFGNYKYNVVKYGKQ